MRYVAAIAIFIVGVTNATSDGIGVGLLNRIQKEPSSLLPLRPDPEAVHDQAMRSLSRAAIATGASEVDRGIRSAKFAERNWPQDRDVPLILRGSVGPMIRDDAPAL